jgi:hypothetical protein
MTGPRDSDLTDSSKRSYAHNRSTLHRATDKNEIMIRTQLFLSLILTLSLIGVGLIGIGKRPGLAKM